MIETIFYVDKAHGKLLSIDVNEDNSFITYIDNREVVTADKQLLISVDFTFPIIRLLDQNRFLIADTRTSNANPNAYIFNYDGKLLTNFLAGDGIEDILIHNNKIIVTYFDEGVFGEAGPNNNGLSVFDLNGEFQFGFNENKEGLQIYDCYCICRHGTNKILFYAYDIFNVIELNLDVFSWREFKTPGDFEGASAITSNGNKIVFHSSYHDKQSFFMWDTEKSEITKIGEYSPRLRGLENGKFLAFGEKGFTIIDTLNTD